MTNFHLRKGRLPTQGHVVESREVVAVGFVVPYFLALLHSLRDLTSPRRDQTHGPAQGASPHHWTAKEVPRSLSLPNPSFLCLLLPRFSFGNRPRATRPCVYSQGIWNREKWVDEAFVRVK